MRILIFVLASVFAFAPWTIAEAEAPTTAQKAYALAKKAEKRSRVAEKASVAAYAIALEAVKRAGVPGPTGPQGERGTNGTNGTDGAAGANGLDGTNGQDGAQGPQGPQGVQGPAGESGSVGGATAFGYVSPTGTGTTTQGATVTHPGLGVYCITAPDLTALVVSPDGYATEFVYRPGTPGSSCAADKWMVIVAGSGTDVGFHFIGQ